MKVEEIGCWMAFVEVARCESFSQAARNLRVSVPQLSKRIAKLEDQLGVRLFHRTTRVVNLTNEGQALLPRVSGVLEDFSNIESTFERGDKVSGTVRLTSIPFIAHRLLIPTLKSFSASYPDVRIDIDLSESVLNLVDSNIDIAVRIEEPKDSSLIYRKLFPNDLVFCAAPRYLKNHKGKLNVPLDLKNHELLSLGIHNRCRFKNSPQKLGDFTKEKRLNCENGWFLTELAIQGFGVLVRSIWDVRGYLQSGELIQVLKKHPLETFGNVYAVIPTRRYLAPRVRILLEHIIASASQWSEVDIRG